MPKILVIDDEKTILDNLKFVLELEDYEVLTASSAQEGINLFRQKKDQIDTILTDMKMPVLSGMDVVREAKKILPEISVIVLTGHGDMENAILAMKEGAFEYLKKPVNAENLTITVNNAVEKKKLLLLNTQMQQKILQYSNYLEDLQNSAQKILINMLPKSMPEIKGYGFSAEYISCEAVGGDMYEVSDLGDYFGFYVFDVANHGILASVIAIMLKSFIRNVEYNFTHWKENKKFTDMLVDINRELQQNTDWNIFATLFIGLIHKSTRKLTYVSAGHITQYIINKDKVTSLQSTGPILGVFDTDDFTHNEVYLSPGDKLILFTDGILEASSGNCIFGNENILSTTSSVSCRPIGDITKHLIDSVLTYTEGQVLDDMTILGIDVLE